MDEQRQARQHPVNPRRRKRTQFEIFREVYLPSIIVCIALLLILTFTIGAICRSFQYKRLENNGNSQLTAQQKEELERLEAEASSLMTSATALAKTYDYDSALAILDTFSGNWKDFPKLAQIRNDLTSAKDSLVLWEDNSKVLNLSFQLLVVDPTRAFQDETYGTSYNRNFITTTEFTRILQQLYENGYILVRQSDLTFTQTTSDGTVQITDSPLYLPSGKKPVIITQTNVNYNLYMVDSDGDKLADQGGDGFANRMLIDDNGNLACEYIDATGAVDTGAYDLVPILEAFITTHPDFSYKGARATLALTGYNGLLGYRTTVADGEFFGETYRQDQITQVKQVVKKLRDTGYEIACYTYENTAYGESTVAQINADLHYWTNEVLPILGNVDTLVFAMNSDISNSGTNYSGEKFNALTAFGFQYFIGFCDEGTPWQVIGGSYVRQGRLMVTGSNLAHNGQWFDCIFDPSTVLERNPSDIPA